MTIPNITIPDTAIRPIVINGTGIRHIRNVWTWDASVRDVQIAEIRPWETTSSLVTPLEPPVVFEYKEFNPTATLFSPVVVEYKAALPIPTLLCPVVAEVMAP